MTADGLLSGFSVTGHAGAGEYGQDIVCAAVSSATYMTANDLCMEEYVEMLRMQKNPLKVIGVDGCKYEIYYFSVDGDTKIEVPANYTYTVSGTNDGGVVVTVNLSKTAAPAATDADTAATTVADDEA